MKEKIQKELEEKLRIYNPRSTKQSQIKLGEDILFLREMLASYETLPEVSQTEKKVNKALESKQFVIEDCRSTLGKVWAIKKVGM
mgnify:CR=1 FL=1